MVKSLDPGMDGLTFTCYWPLCVSVSLSVEWGGNRIYLADLLKRLNNCIAQDDGYHANGWHRVSAPSVKSIAAVLTTGGRSPLTKEFLLLGRDPWWLNFCTYEGIRVSSCPQAPVYPSLCSTFLCYICTSCCLLCVALISRIPSFQL